MWSTLWRCWRTGAAPSPAHDDNTLRLWDLESGEVIATFTADAAITCLAVVRDDLFVAGSGNGAVHILRLIE